MHTIYQCDIFFDSKPKTNRIHEDENSSVEEQIVSIHYLAAKPKPPLNENISE